MQIVVPMAGAGTRFVQAGYTSPKPLIEVDGMPVIEHVIRLFPGERQFLFVCARNHLEETPLRSVLRRLAPSARIVGIEPHKRGPVHTALEAREFISDEEPVVLNYCDFSVYWSYARFKQQMEELTCAGCITAYRGFHPHSLGSNLYAYLREHNRFLTEIQEKRCFTDQRMNEYASAGTYYFRSGALLKRYFQRAIERDLQTNGEYYASMPYNLMVEDGLDVYVYELEHFLQWGTPEDLEEYRAWSGYFAGYADWKPSLPPMAGTNLIAMAGSGMRFEREGYGQPKPFVPVAGMPMVRRALRTVPPAKAWIAACRPEHLGTPAFDEAVCAGARDVRILPVDEPTEGQACTCLLARPWINPAEALLIAPCDAATVYDEERYAALMSDAAVDCLVWTFRNHPHANRNPRQYGWVRTTPVGDITGISCKVPISANSRHAPGIIGIFWFRKARFFLEAADALVAQNRRVNNEFYVDSVIEVLLEQGRRARVFDVQHYISFGSPDDVRTYDYWAAYFAKASHHPYKKREPR